MNFKTDYKIVSNVLSDHKKIIDNIKQDRNPLVEMQCKVSQSRNISLFSIT